MASIYVETLFRDSFTFCYAVAAHETGNFTSNVFMKCKNLFGMGVARVREKDQLGPCYAVVSKGGEPTFAAYVDYRQSVRDFLLWFKYHNWKGKNNDPMERVSFMKSKGYFTGDFNAYLNSVRSIQQNKAYPILMRIVLFNFILFVMVPVVVGVAFWKGGLFRKEKDRRK